MHSSIHSVDVTLILYFLLCESKELPGFIDARLLIRNCYFEIDAVVSSVKICLTVLEISHQRLYVHAEFDIFDPYFL